MYFKNTDRWSDGEGFGIYEGKLYSSIFKHVHHSKDQSSKNPLICSMLLIVTEFSSGFCDKKIKPVNWQQVQKIVNSAKRVLEGMVTNMRTFEARAEFIVGV